MNTEQLGRLLTALEAIAANTGRIADALEATADISPAEQARLRNSNSATDLNPKGPYA